MRSVRMTAATATTVATIRCDRGLYSATVKSASRTGSATTGPQPRLSESTRTMPSTTSGERWRSRSAATLARRPSSRTTRVIPETLRSTPNAPAPMTKITSTGPMSSSHHGSRQPRAVVSGRSPSRFTGRAYDRRWRSASVCPGNSSSSLRRIRGISSVRPVCEHMFVRWSNLSIGEEERARLPGYREEAVVRHFEAPDAISTRFYEVRAKSILNRVPEASQMPFRWTINPYRGCTHSCVYCFARPTHTYLDFNAGQDFEREIVVKVNAPERLRIELAKPSWRGEHIALGTNTDPYQWVEGRYKLMPGIWQAMIDARNPASVLTKSPLLLRDLGLMQELNERAGFGAALSVPTIDEKAWRATEPHTPNPRARLEAVAELNRAGIRTGVLVAPLMPGINDDPKQVEEILEMATEAGAAYVTGIALHLRGEVRGLFLEWLAEHRSDLVERYRALYRKGAYMPSQERRRLAELVKGPVVAPSERGRAAFISAARPEEPTPTPAQESLFDLGMLGETSGTPKR